MTDSATPITLTPKDPLAAGLTAAKDRGTAEHLAHAAARGHPLARVFLNGPAVVRLPIDAGADPSARSAEGPSETPLHWAASNDDVDVAAALVEGGADIEAPGASVAGGSPLNNAVGYGCWHVARLLVERGAAVSELWLAGALGMHERVEALLDAHPPSQEGLDEAFWQACHGGQLRMAQLLLARGAHIDPVPGYGDGQSPLDIAGDLDERRSQLVRWLGEHGAKTAAKPASPS